ncbi:MAG: hypothetical protein U9O20_03930 [Patescibacteria group bacterium]|nr:hypothetical protein [Patescibacteria group bacterium]
MRKKILWIAILMLVLVTFVAAPMAMEVDGNGWVDGINTWEQWQDSNFAEHLVPDNGGHLDGNSHMNIDMWGGAGAGVGDPASYTSELFNAHGTEVEHAIMYKLDGVQKGFMDITADPGEEKGISIGGENNSHADLSSSFKTWKNDDDGCSIPADKGHLTASVGNAPMDMSGWVTGVEKGDKGIYQAQLLQKIGHERENTVAGGKTWSASTSTQLGTIEIKLEP